MAEEQKTKLRLEIAHVLFIDIVAYSKLSIDEQRRAIERLNEIVQQTQEFQKAESAKRKRTFCHPALSPGGRRKFASHASPCCFT